MEGRRRKRTRLILRGGVRGHGPRDEPRLLRGREAAGGLEAEGGADRLAGERAEGGPAEIAITTRCFRSLAHRSSRSGGPGLVHVGDTRRLPPERKRCRPRKLTNFRQFSGGR